ncbi:Ig-like domain-containing protein [Sediminitomix flava]|uniref:Gliding motility-associated-like protein n=1 Tax=Sediminitomix flava TaxID=379075 RepID=A0A315ZK18_SEDFL|nr:Ig-like domain-containing protein [Sediminitomix flava]PWJ45034.1 gliding motility-associated-like protein [Sediminitomix flava]
MKPKDIIPRKRLLLALLLLLGSFFMSFQINQITSILDKIYTMGGWNSIGRPDYLLERNFIEEEIREQVVELIGDSIANGGNDFLARHRSNILISEDDCELICTFVTTDAGWANVLGYYTYHKDSVPETPEDIDSLHIIYPHIQRPHSLDAGDRVSLGTFPKDIVVGFFLIANGWDSGNITEGYHTVYSNHLLNTVASEENMQHMLMFWNQLENENNMILCIEDNNGIRPGGDQDFNDCIFYVTPSPKSNAVITPAFDNDPPVALDDNATTNYDFPVTIDVMANDSDPNGDALLPSSVYIINPPNVGGALAIVDDNGNITYNPVEGYVGPDSFTYAICDNTSQPKCDTATVFITIEEGNIAPSAQDDYYTIEIGQSLTQNVLENDSDEDNSFDFNSLQIINPPSVEGAITVVSDSGIISYIPPSDFIGLDTLSYEICDTGNPTKCTEATVYIDVIPTNEPPVSEPDSAETTNELVVSKNVLENDSDPDGQLHLPSFEIITHPSIAGAFVFITDSTITYTPQSTFVGRDSVQYQICDNAQNELCTTNWLYIDILEGNQPPIANNDTTEVIAGNSVSIPILTNDIDTDGEFALNSLQIISGPVIGGAEVSISDDGTLVYTSPANYTGPDVLLYEVCDNGLPQKCDIATVIINIIEPNQAPIATLDTVSIVENTEARIPVAANDLDPNDDLDEENVDIIVPPTSGGNAEIDSSGVLVYTPPTDFVGTDTIVYQICDLGVPPLCDTDSVFISVLPTPSPPNEPPVAIRDDVETDANTPINIKVIKNDVDPDNNIDSTSIEIITPSPISGTVVVINDDGSIDYTPAPNFVGIDVLIYQVCDEEGLCDTGIVYVSIGGDQDNEPPLALRDDVMGKVDSTLIIPVYKNDIDPEGELDTISVEIVSTSNLEGAIVELDSTGNIIYTPPTGYVGNDVVIYKICDKAIPRLCDSGVLYITIEEEDEVIPVNNPPITTNDNISIYQGDTICVDVLVNDIDIDLNLDSTSLSIADGPLGSGATAYINDEYKIIYKPDSTFTGQDIIIYSICDSGDPKLCDSGILTIQVLPDTTTQVIDNILPVVQNDTVYTTVNSSIFANVLNNDYDDDDGINKNSITIIESTTLTGASAIVAGFAIQYNPSPDYIGTDQIVYRVCDKAELANCGTAILTIIIEDENQPPVAEVDQASTKQNVAITINLTENDVDPDGEIDNTSLRIIEGPLVGGAFARILENGEIEYTPEADYYGYDTLTYRVCDNHRTKACTTSQVIIEILDPKSLPPDIPNVFTPNQDGYNDTFSIDNLEGHYLNEMVIFNRWGQEIYRKGNYNNDWDGYNQLGNPLPGGTYYYIFKSFTTGTQYSGYVVIKR